MLSDQQLIEKIKSNDNDSLIELVNRHERLYLKMSGGLRLNALFDFEREKYHFFYGLAKAYDHTRGMKFSTFLGQRTKFLCKTLASKKYRESELSDEIPSKVSCNTDDTVSILHQRIKDLNNPKARKILLTRYFHKSGEMLPFAKIAPKLGMSARNVKNIHDRYIKLLRNYV